MKHFHAGLRLLYTPVQPAVSHLATSVNYREFLPHPHLRQFIYCYWLLDNTHIEAFEYCVVADGCIDVFFDLDNPSDSFVMGFSDKFTKFNIDGQFRYAGIRFLPSMFPQLFKLKASEISNHCEELKMVLPQFDAFISNWIRPGEDFDAIQEALNRYFLRLIEASTLSHDPRLYRAIDIILEKAGIVQLETEIDAGISARQLRRIFEYYVGDSPKTFSKIVRFQHFLKAGASFSSLDQRMAFYQAGYFDQAHFIKDFKQLYGVTPGLILGNK